MRAGFHILSLSRPVCMLLLIVPSLISAPTVGLLAFYVVSAAFFVASSAIIVGWIPASSRWSRGLLWAEIALVTAVNFAATPQRQHGGPLLSLFTVLYLTLFLAFERVQWPLALLATTAGWLAVVWLPFQPPMTWSALLVTTGLYAGAMLFFSGIGLLIRNQIDEAAKSARLLEEVSSARSALERAHRQLVESAASQQEMAVLEERQRLAREIHDSVAHSLTALVVQLQVARRMAEHSPEQSIQGLSACEETARQALFETRQAVRALHPTGLEQQSDVEALRRLAQDYSLATKIAVEVHSDHCALLLPPDPVRTEQLYRIFQEALTNAHRHGEAKAVAADLRIVGDKLIMTITNDGNPPQGLEPGVGLRSMKERARLLGGSVMFEPLGRGLKIEVSIPVGQEAVS